MPLVVVGGWCCLYMVLSDNLVLIPVSFFCLFCLLCSRFVAFTHSLFPYFTYVVRGGVVLYMFLLSLFSDPHLYFFLVTSVRQSCFVTMSSPVPFSAGASGSAASHVLRVEKRARKEDKEEPPVGGPEFQASPVVPSI
jgi:hypothetical protein